MLRDTNIGIDSIAFSTSRYFLPLSVLAEHRSVDYRKYCDGIGQIAMSVFPPNEDIVTIAVDAAQKAISFIDNLDAIDLVIFATESSFDLSKAAAIYVHNFLKLKPSCTAFDIKQACYSLTAAIKMARCFVQSNPGSKVLVIGSDIVKYSPNSSGEPTQGGAAVAAVISENPRIIAFEPYSGVHTTDIADFWRPSAAKEAMFDGRLSAHNYLESLKFALDEYLQKSKLALADLDYVCFHSPFNKMATKAARQFFPEKDVLDASIYNAKIGNSCSASLYISLISLLDNCSENLGGKRIGLYSYGSGSVAEYFSGIVCDKYREMSLALKNQELLDSRIEISFDEYEQFCANVIPASDTKCSYQNVGQVFLSEMIDGYRMYQLKEQINKSSVDNCFNMLNIA
ncbi:MAG: hydroxymethylglutaryl-CoA synthase [Alphaproteobacteria bacterium]|nr:hydroxymethylglutaryl-CoA synthase [Alphaproteobacteria bacterium]